MILAKAKVQLVTRKKVSIRDYSGLMDLIKTCVAEEHLPQGLSRAPAAAVNVDFHTRVEPEGTNEGVFGWVSLPKGKTVSVNIYLSSIEYLLDY